MKVLSEDMTLLACLSPVRNLDLFMAVRLQWLQEQWRPVLAVQAVFPYSVVMGNVWWPVLAVQAVFPYSVVMGNVWRPVLAVQAEFPYSIVMEMSDVQS